MNRRIVLKNIVFILADQLRKDSLSCYGNAVVKTPNLERLSKKSRVFNRCYVANPICMPDRLSIFTGMYPRNHGLWTNGLLLEHERRTLATELSDHGYETASYGKIHFEPFMSPLENNSRESVAFWENKGDDIDWFGPYWGFQHVELTIAHTKDTAHYGSWYRKNGGTKAMYQTNEDGTTSIPKELHDSSFVGERASDYIKNQRDKSKPFFMVASFPDPHHPFNPPQDCAKRYTLDDAIQPIGFKEDLVTRPAHYQEHYRGGWHRKGKVSEQHPNGIDSKQEKRRIINTYAMVDLIDENIGKILDALESEGLMDDTIIVFTSDHGELLGDHGLWTKGPFFYEGLINVPLMIYTPDGNAGVSETLFSSVDIFPTICDLLEIETAIYVNGLSQKPHLMNPDLEVRDKCLIEYHNGYGENDCSSKVLVTKNLKYVRYETGECELTDLKNDPQEKENIALKENYRSLLHKANEDMLDEILATELKHPKQISHA